MRKLYPAAASDFWMDEHIQQVGEQSDIMELSSYRRAVANFVRIVTGEHIPVRFSRGGDSYTDGKAVTISASTKLEDRDSMVGLALHEGSHIKLTDFVFCSKTLNRFGIKDWLQPIQLLDRWTAMLTSELKWQDYHAVAYLKDLLNYVEDRRIDHYVITTAPGYQPYYQALYDRYFNAPVISKGLRSSEYRTETWESYLFRLINITNPSTDLDALSGLRRIHACLDLPNISRLTSTEASLLVAFDILEIIHDSILANQLPIVPETEPETAKQPTDTDEETKTGGTGKTGGQPPADTEPKSNQSEEGEDEETMPDQNDDTADGETDEESGGLEDHDPLPELSAADKKRLQKVIDDQRALQSGQIKKKSVSKRAGEMISAIDDSDIVISEATYSGQKVPVTVIRKFNRKLVDYVDCPMWSSGRYGRNPANADAVNTGIRLGTVLGKKLKVRAEERSLRFNRLRTGKIDKRMISQAGGGMENIFEKLEIFSYKPGIIHLSIDNSGSMSGQKFYKSLTTAAAIAKACSMIENMDCIISFRSTGSISDVKANNPCIVIAYDSRRQSISELRALLPCMNCPGTTPEGLCFDAILKDIIDTGRGKDAYFVNFSDGQPYYTYSGKDAVNYQGRSAWTHTRQQINKMKENGIRVISYFIHSGNMRDNEIYTFKEMYGRDAQFIDVTQITQVAKTLNDKFLEQ